MKVSFPLVLALFFTSSHGNAMDLEGVFPVPEDRIQLIKDQTKVDDVDSEAMTAGLLVTMGGSAGLIHEQNLAHTKPVGKTRRVLHRSLFPIGGILFALGAGNNLARLYVASHGLDPGVYPLASLSGALLGKSTAADSESSGSSTLEAAK